MLSSPLPCLWTNFAGLHWQQYLRLLVQSLFAYAHMLHWRASRHGSSDGFSLHFLTIFPSSYKFVFISCYASTSITNRAAPSVIDMVLPTSSTRTVGFLCWNLYGLTYKDSSVTCHEQYRPTALLFIACLQLMKLELVGTNEHCVEFFYYYFERVTKMFPLK